MAVDTDRLSGGRRRAFHASIDGVVDAASIEQTQKEQLKGLQAYLRSSPAGECDEEGASAFARFVLSQRFEAFGGCVVLINIVIITLETHARALNNNSLLSQITQANRILLAYYIFECSARLFVLRASFFCGVWNMLDLTIVCTGVISEVMEAIALSTAGVEQIGMLKSLRMMRLIRLVRLLVAFRELYVLLAGLGRCMKTLLWASGLIFLVINVWAIVSVEWLDRIAQDLDAEGAFGTCSWCKEAFADVWKANLTWFQVVSGDGWSVLGRPMAERQPWTYLFFVSNICVMVWGLLNLVVAAIVDSSIQAREEDVQGAARNAVRARNMAFESFRSLCREMDKDGDGAVTTEEFKEFKDTNIQLQQHLEVMGITDDDFEKCLTLMDVDGNGELDFDEFAQEFTKMSCLVVKTNLYYVLRHVEFLHESIADMHITHRQMIRDISALCTDMQEMKGVISPGSECRLQNSDDIAHRFDVCGDASRVTSKQSVGADSSSVRAPLPSRAGIVKPECTAASVSVDKSFCISSQARQEQLLTHWSQLNSSTVATLDHCNKLYQSEANAPVGVMEIQRIPEKNWRCGISRPEEMIGQRRQMSTALAKTSNGAILPGTEAVWKPAPTPSPKPPGVLESPRQNGS